MRTLSPSQKRAWLDCRGKWAYAYVEGLVPVEPAQERLTVGKYLHEVIRRYHTEAVAKRSKEMLMEDLANVWDGALSEASHKKAVNILNTFWNTLGRDEEVEPVGTEQELSVQLPHDVRAHGFLDDLRVDHAARHVVIGELKTGDNPDEDFYALFNPQIYDYAWMAQKTWPGYTIEARHTLLGPSTTVRRTIPIDVRVLDETEQEWHTVVEEMYGEHPSRIVYNRTFRCAPRGSSSGCPYYELCLARMTGADVEAMKAFRYGKKAVEVEQEEVESV